MYIMCVILCLFRAMSRRVGALQISIIICYLSLDHNVHAYSYCTDMYTFIVRQLDNLCTEIEYR